MNDYYPLVSVLIPTFNNEKYILGAIESILSQTYSNVEIIIVHKEYGPEDDTQNIVSKYKSDNRVKYFKQTGVGYAAAYNQAYRAAKGEFLCFQDADDLSLPSRIEEEVRVLLDNHDIEMVYSQAYFLDDFDQPFRIWGGLRAGRIPGKEIFYKIFSECHNFIPNTSVMFRRRHVRGDMLFSEDLPTSADCEHHLRLSHDYDLYEIHKPLVMIRRGSNHRCLSSDRILNLSMEREIRRRIRREYRTSKPRIRLIHLLRAESNLNLNESSFFYQRRDLINMVSRMALAFIINPVNHRYKEVLERAIASYRHVD